MRIYLVRHGQTLFNVKKRIQGWCDSALTQEGIQQARMLSKGLQNINFTHAYSSTSERAVDTANYILEAKDILVEPLKALKEMNFGTIEGEYESDYLAKDGSSHDIGFEGYGGETIALTSKRMVNALTTIAQNHPDEDVLVVSHGGAIMCALLGLFKLAVEDFRKKGQHIENCSVTILEYTDKFTLHTISDTSFLTRGQEGA